MSPVRPRTGPPGEARAAAPPEATLPGRFPASSPVTSAAVAPDAPPGPAPEAPSAFPARPSPDAAAEAGAFWRFSLRFYARPGVPDACLALQDRDGLDVNLLLFAAWMGHERGLRLGPEGVRAAAAAVAPWQAEVVVPLRALRRRLKDGPPPAPDAATGAMRNAIKAVELEAERVEQETLQRLAGTIPAVPAPAGAALAAANMRAVAGLPEGASGAAATRRDIAALAAALEAAA